MNCRNAALAVMLAVMLSFGFVAVCDDADAADALKWGTNNVEVHEFDDMGKGSVTVYLTNTTDSPIDTKLKVTDAHNSGDVLAEKDVTVPASTENFGVELSFGYQSTGNREVNISASGISDIQGGVGISVSHNIWKDSMTYILIIAVIIVIAAIAYLYMRNAPKRKAAKMTDTTFTELESQRQKKKSERKSSGPKKYSGKKE